MPRTPKTSRAEVGSHVVEVRNIDGTDRLFIDGVVMPYHTAPAGYTVRRAMYAEPQKTLLAAGKKYAELLVEIEKGTEG